MRVTTDHDEITAALDAALAHDPVRATVFGTMRAALRDTAWAALGPDGAIAVRSEARYPVALDGAWPDVQPLAAELARLAGLVGVSGCVDVVEPLAVAVGRPVGKRVPQGLYRLDQLTVPGDVAGSGGRADRSERDLIVGWFEAFTAELNGFGGDAATQVEDALAAGLLWVWRDTGGAAVAMAHRRRVVAGSARIGPVYTRPDQRGRGYGSAVTAAASASILAEEAVPVLFTELANPTSNKIYQALGYRLVENRVMIRFR